MMPTCERKAKRRMQPNRNLKAGKVHVDPMFVYPSVLQGGGGVGPSKSGLILRETQLHPCE